VVGFEDQKGNGRNECDVREGGDGVVRKARWLGVRHGDSFRVESKLRERMLRARQSSPGKEREVQDGQRRGFESR